MITSPHQGSTPAGADDRRPVVVGIDGSASSLRALQWALEEGLRRQAPVTVVHAWNSLTAEIGPTCPSRQSAYEFVALEIDTAAADLTVRPNIVELVTEGSAARALVDLSVTAGVLVIGQSRHAVEGGMLAGSVCAICARRARCPVIIVPERGDPMVHVPARVTAAATNPSA